MFLKAKCCLDPEKEMRLLWPEILVQVLRARAISAANLKAPKIKRTQEKLESLATTHQAPIPILRIDRVTLVHKELRSSSRATAPLTKTQAAVLGGF